MNNIANQNVGLIRYKRCEFLSNSSELEFEHYRIVTRTKFEPKLGFESNPNPNTNPSEVNRIRI